MPKTDQESCSYPRPSSLKISSFSFFYADKFNAFAEFIGTPYYAPHLAMEFYKNNYLPPTL